MAALLVLRRIPALRRLSGSLMTAGVLVGLLLLALAGFTGPA